LKLDDVCNQVASPGLSLADVIATESKFQLLLSCFRYSKRRI